MKLRKECEHGKYDPHYIWMRPEDGPEGDCPGGVFLPDDTLVVERLEDRELYRAVKRLISEFHDGPSPADYDVALPEIEEWVNRNGSW